MRLLLCSLLLALLAPFPPALARTHLVGPGGFSTLQKAVDAAVSGDKIIVRTPFHSQKTKIVGKSLWLHSDTGSMLGNIEWTLTQATQFARITGISPFRLPWPSMGPRTQWKISGPGQVLIEECRGQGEIYLRNCQHSVLRDLQLTGRFDAYGCRSLHLAGCTLRGWPGKLGIISLKHGVPAMYCSRSHLFLERSSLRGGTGDWRNSWGVIIRAQDGPGLVVKDSTVLYAGTKKDQISSDSVAAVQGDRSSIEWGGAVIIARKVTGAAAISGTQLTLLNRGVTSPPWVKTDAFVQGKTTQIEVGGRPGAAVVLLVSSGPAVLPTPFGTIRVDLSRLFFTYPLLLGPTGLATLPMPNNKAPALRGVGLFLQTVQLNGPMSLRMSGLCAGVIRG